MIDYTIETYGDNGLYIKLLSQYEDIVILDCINFKISSILYRSIYNENAIQNWKPHIDDVYDVEIILEFNSEETRNFYLYLVENRLENINSLENVYNTLEVTV